MMGGLIEVVEGGIGNSIQDRGRFGFRHMGITVSGSLDALLARCANALVGNPAECACIEIRAAGPRVAVRQGRVRVALAGEVGAVLYRADGEEFEIAPWQSLTLGPQDELEVGYLPGGTAYLAVSGGIDSPLQLGSRSTYQRALIGGIDGLPIQTGNVLRCSAQKRPEYHEYSAQPWRYDDSPLRVVLGPQDTHFQPDALSGFVAAEYRVTPQLDRMGVRLDGPALQHLTPAAADIVSDGVTPGAIQVPGNGQPIILLADCQTVGGYPKIATVISADLPRLGQLRPGQVVRFAAVGLAEAREALRAREAQWAQWAGGVVRTVAATGAECGDLSGGASPDA